MTDEKISQLDASLSVLAASQEMSFPYSFQEMGLDLIVHRDVFSPFHFNGWRIFTRNFPDVKGKDVLEIGSGHGATSIYLAKYGRANKIVAVDINPNAVENTIANSLANEVRVDTRLSDIFSAIKEGERFDYIYWNMPFMRMPDDYQYRSILERGLFDPGFRLAKRFLSEGKDYLKSHGAILAGTGNFGDVEELLSLAEFYHYSPKLIAKEETTEINPVDFQLWEFGLRREDDR